MKGKARVPVLKRFIYVVLWVVLTCGSVSPLYAQGCALCKTTAAAQSSQATRALNRGILVLLAPPVTIMSAILVFAFRCRNSPRQ